MLQFMLAASCGMEMAYVVRGSDIVNHLQKLCGLEHFLQGRSRCYSVSSLVRWLAILGVGLLVNLSPDEGGLAAMAPATDEAAVTGTAHEVPSYAPLIQTGSPAMQSAEELRRTIEESVLNKVVCGIREHQEKVDRGEHRPRPFVTLTYAQSIDGSIAAADRSQVLLSGTESRTMTHGLRSCHDAILVGAGTVRQDNPRLNIRHWPPGIQPFPASNHNEHSQSNSPVADSPRAVILADSLGRLPRNFRLGGALIFTDLSSPDTWKWLNDWAYRSREGSSDRAANDLVIINCRLTPDGRCDLGDCLEKLYYMGFKSVMVEGGATVISSFLQGCEQKMRTVADSGTTAGDGQLVDRIVITIAPVFLQGYNVLAPATNALGLRFPLLDVSYVRLGRDLVLVGAPTTCQTTS